MIRSISLGFLLLLAVTATSASAGQPGNGLKSAGPVADSPNIVLINIDDLGYGDIGPFGSTQNSTPNLDRMAAEGRLLKSHYAAPVCSPSRASLMTGSYPKRSLPIEHVLFPASSVGLHPSELTIAEVMKSARYTTACIGKWHLGDQPQFLPTAQGFDYYFGIPYSNDMGNGLDGSKSNPGEPLPDRPQPSLPDRFPADGLRGATQPPLPLLQNLTVIEAVDANGQTTLTERYVDEARSFITANREQPFFLYLPHTAVHFPLYPGLKFRNQSGHGLFSDWVSEVDWAVGQILDTLKEHQLDHRTLVIFTSDNGGATRHGANNTPLRGQKGQTFEGGVRVPTIVRWPGVIPAGSETSKVSSHMDFLPTFAKLVQAELPANRVLDGVDLWPIISGLHPDAAPRTVFHYFRGHELQAIRSGAWKLHLKSGELYNLESDIGEADNLASTNSNVVIQLQDLAAEMDADLGITGIGPGCRALGRVSTAFPLIDHEGKFRALPGAGE